MSYRWDKKATGLSRVGVGGGGGVGWGGAGGGIYPLIDFVRNEMNATAAVGVAAYNHNPVRWFSLIFPSLVLAAHLPETHRFFPRLPILSAQQGRVFCDKEIGVPL